MQEPYHIKVSLQEYYEKFDPNLIPDFSDKCILCGGAGCASYHGYYTRAATCPLTGFSVPDLPVLRFICKNKGDQRKCDHVTFSLLPIMLVPFRQLTLKFMILAVWLRLSKCLSLTEALDIIEKELNSLEDTAQFINVSTLMSWQRLIQTALSLYLSSNISLISLLSEFRYEETATNQTGLLLFLEAIKDYKPKNTGASIRGPDAFSRDFYQQSGGAERLAFFLFGMASQHRK